MRTFRSVTLPLMAGGLLAGFILVLSLTFQGLSVPIILAGPGNEVLPVLVFDLYQSGQYGPLNALGVFILIVLLVLVAILQRLSKRVGLGSPPG